MRIISVGQTPIIRKALLAGATIAGTLGVGAAMTSCANAPLKFGYPYEEFKSNSPYNSELKKESINWINKDPDAQGDCLGRRLDVKTDTSFVCTQGKNAGDTINYWLTSGTKEKISSNPNIEPVTYVLEDVAAGKVY